jgi:hypothetical protein
MVDAWSFLSRLLKTAHLRRWPTSPLAATYLEYVSLGLWRAALHLGPFEQPGRKEVSYQRAAVSFQRNMRKYSAVSADR